MLKLILLMLLYKGGMVMGKKILLTGSGSGIGKDAAIYLAKRGHFVYAATQFHEQAELLNNHAKKKSLPLLAYKLDICNDKDRMQVHHHTIDVLINNAALGESGSVAETPLTKYRQTFETNVFSTLALTQEVLKDMVKRKKGRILFVSSLAGLVPLPFFSPYCASKSAIEALSSSLRSELKVLKNQNINISVATLSPGVYATGFNQLLLSSKFKWMKNQSYFQQHIHTLLKKEIKGFYLFEHTSNRTIVREYVRAVEDKRLRKRYSAPKIQACVIQLIRTLSSFF